MTLEQRHAKLRDTLERVQRKLEARILLGDTKLIGIASDVSTALARDLAIDIAKQDTDAREWEANRLSYGNCLRFEPLPANYKPRHPR